MSIPTSVSYPSARSGKPININDQATVIGFVSSVAGTGPAAVVTIQLAGSNALVNVQAQDVAATAQTL